MHEMLAKHEPPTKDVGAEWLAEDDPTLFRLTVCCLSVKALTIVNKQRAYDRPTEAVCLVQDSFEYRHQVAWGGVDHLQHLGCRDLLLQRLSLLVQQPCVLYCDHR